MGVGGLGHEDEVNETPQIWRVYYGTPRLVPDSKNKVLNKHFKRLKVCNRVPVRFQIPEQGVSEITRSQLEIAVLEFYRNGFEVLIW